MNNLYILFLGLLFPFLSCDKPENSFKGEIAYNYLQKQCDLGPRAPGTQGHEKAKNMYIDFFKKYGDSTYTQQFKKNIPQYGKRVKLTNIITEFGHKKDNPLLIGTHWDTRNRAEKDPDPSKRNQPILGANDGASGVAILMHLAELLSDMNLNRKVYLVLFDGEDQGTHGNNQEWCLGSRYFVKNMPVDKPREVIIADMVGDAELSLPIERYSYNNSRELVNQIWDIAESNGFTQFKNEVGNPIYDDHVPFNQEDIPAVNLIDFHYPNKYTNYWHTTLDTPDKCSPQSLQVVGQVILEYIRKSPQ